MKKNLKFTLYFGLILIIGSCIYDFLFIGIPFQDPTPELIARREQQYLIKDIIWYSGVIIFTLGIIGVLLLKLRKTTP